MPPCATESAVVRPVSEVMFEFAPLHAVPASFEQSIAALADTSAFTILVPRFNLE